MSSICTTSDLLGYPNIFSISLLRFPIIFISSFDEKEDKPRASSSLFSFKMRILSPFEKDPSILIIPIASKLFPFFKAFSAPLST